MKLLTAIAMLGVLAGGGAMAADYSVGIVNLGTGTLGGGTALNLYATKKTGIDLVQTYVLPQNDFTGNPSSPLTLAMNPAHTFVYVVYTGLSQPNIVGLKMTPTGLVYEWQDEIQTGDAGLQGTTLTAGHNYVIENTYPFGLWEHVVSQAGGELINDYENGGGSSLDAHRRQQIVAEPVRDLREEVGRCGHHDDRIGLARQVDVGHVVRLARIPLAGEDRAVRQRLQGHRGDELLGRRGHHDLHGRAGLDQLAREVGGLVAGDAARQAEHDVLARQHDSPSPDEYIGRSPEGMRARLGAARRWARRARNTAQAAFKAPSTRATDRAG